MALIDHARLPAFIEGQFLEELTSITFRTESGQQRVETLEGLAGFTPGSGICTATFNSAIPIDGEEFAYQPTCVAGSYVSVQIGVGTVAYTGTGKILDVEISQSVNASVEEAITWEGELAALE
jgi:hypothetical protein